MDFKISNFTMEAFLKECSDKELANLSMLITQERDRRFKQKEDDGQFPALNEQEKGLFSGPSWIKGIQAYRDRTGLNLVDAKLVADKFRYGK